MPLAALCTQGSTARPLDRVSLNNSFPLHLGEVNGFSRNERGKSFLSWGLGDGAQMFFFSN